MRLLTFRVTLLIRRGRHGVDDDESSRGREHLYGGPTSFMTPARDLNNITDMDRA